MIKKVVLLIIMVATTISADAAAVTPSEAGSDFCADLALRQSVSTQKLTFTVRGLTDSNSKDAKAPPLLYPAALAYDAHGNLYIADRDANRILRFDEGGRKLQVVAGPLSLKGRPPASGFRDGLGLSARFNRPSGIAIGADGKIYVVDSGNNAIRVVTPSGYVKTLLMKNPNASVAVLKAPTAVATDNARNIFFADSKPGILKLDRAGIMRRLPLPAGEVKQFSVTGTSPYTTLFIADSSGLRLLTTWDGKMIHFPIRISKNHDDNSLEGGRPIGVPYVVLPINDQSALYTDQEDGTIRFIDFTSHIGRVVAHLDDAPIGMAAKDSRTLVVSTARHGILLISKLDLRMPLIPSGSHGLSDLNFNQRDYVVFFVGTSLIWWNTDWTDSIEGQLEISLNAASRRRKIKDPVHVVPVQMPSADIPTSESFINEISDLSYTRIVILDLHASFLASTFSIPAELIAEKGDLWKDSFRQGISKLKQSLDARGEKLLIVLHPEEFELLESPHPRLETLLTAQLKAIGANVLDLYPSFSRALQEHRQLYGICDKHLEAAGRALTAEQVAEYINVFWPRQKQ